MHWQWNDAEDDALLGLPWLARVIYLQGLRRYMDYATGIVGLKRGISYQSLREVAYIEPGQGIRRSGSPTLEAVRHALRQLEKAGLAEKRKADSKLVFFLPLANEDRSAPEKYHRRATDRMAEKYPSPPKSEYPKEEKSASHSRRAAPDAGDIDGAVAEVIAHLNAVTGSAFKARLNGKPTKTAELVRARIAEHGKTALLAVIERKTAEWKHDERMRRYLRPATLFGREKCEQYVGQLSVPLRVKPDKRAEIAAWANGPSNVIEGAFKRERTG